MNGAISGSAWSYQGWKCDRVQSRFSNSVYRGSTATTKSIGIPSYKSNAAVAPSSMSGYSGSGTDGIGNPLIAGANYLQTWKWGDTRITKWTAGENSAEKGAVYEGE